jgi:hypothetical protein
MEAFKERRNYERYSVNNLSCILVSPIMVLSFGVWDISDSGLAFGYSCHTGWENWPIQGIRLDIIDKKFSLEDIPFQLIENIRFNNGFREFRRCGVQFACLETDQKARLRQYIRHVSSH